MENKLLFIKCNINLKSKKEPNLLWKSGIQNYSSSMRTYSYYRF